MADVVNNIDLDLVEIPRVGPGRQPANVTSEFVRELTVEDLQTPAVSVQAAPSIKAIRDTHHALARVLATGTSEADASRITGYSPSRISILKADPQFQDLLKFYRDTAVEAYTDFKERMINVGMSALTELGERLEEKPEQFSVGHLTEVVKTMADRTGHAPASSGKAGVNVNINLQNAMSEARARVEAFRAAQEPKVIDHE